MQFLKTNTAVIVTVGPFLDATDGVTLETGLTITNERISLTADTDAGSAPTYILDNITGATSGTSNDLNYITSGDNAMMQIELSAANVNRLGRMRLTITDAANHCPVWEDYIVLPAMIYDSLVLGTDDLDTNSKKWNDLTTVALPLIPTTAGRTLDVSATGEGGVDWANVGSPTTSVTLSGTTVGTVTTATTATNLTNAPTNGDLTATMKTSVATAALTTAMTESYNTDGSTATLAQAMYLIIAYLMERNITSTTLTAKKIDGSTTAATFTLNDATNPTAITRAT